MRRPCQMLHELFAGLPRHTVDFDNSQIPLNGIYVMFQSGELAHGLDRIVRIGTHRGQDRLRKRLRQHFHNKRKDSSIFRKHVGRALLARSSDPFFEQWNLNLSTRKSCEKHMGDVDLARQEEVESEVSEYLAGNITFSVLEIFSKAERSKLKKSVLSTIAACGECRALIDWLGHHHPHPTIRNVGLWNIQGLKGMPMTEDEAGQFTKLLRH